MLSIVMFKFLRDINQILIAYFSPNHFIRTSLMAYEVNLNQYKLSTSDSYFPIKIIKKILEISRIIT